MLSIKELLDFSLLAQAAYADLLRAKEPDGTFNLQNSRTLLELEGDGGAFFTTFQAGHFLNVDANNPQPSGYTILEQRTDKNGFSATLFLDNVTEEKILSVRGTDDLDDIFTDVVSIAILGTTEIQWQYQSLLGFYQELIDAGHLETNESFDVTGHSLGK